MPKVNSVKCRVYISYKTKNTTTPLTFKDLKEHKLKNKNNFALDIQTYLLRHFNMNFLDPRRFSISNTLMDCLKEHVRYKLQDPSAIVEDLSIQRYLDNNKYYIEYNRPVAQYVNKNSVCSIQYKEIPSYVKELYNLYMDILQLRYNLSSIIPMPRERRTLKEAIYFDYMDYFLNLSLVPNEILDSIDEIVEDCKKHNFGKGFEVWSCGHRTHSRYLDISPYINLFFYDLNIYPTAKRKLSVIGDLYCSAQQKFKEFKLIGAVQ